MPPWFIVLPVVSIASWVLFAEFPILAWIVTGVSLVFVIVSLIASPATGVIVLGWMIGLALALVFLRFFFFIIIWLAGALVGLMFIYYLIIGLGQLASRL